MKNIMISMIFVLSANTFAASYDCVGAKGTVLESFKLDEITETNISPELDGSFDGVTLEKNMLSYTFNNGCDNDVTFRVNKNVPESQPYKFNMRVDYYGPDDYLTDTEVICFQTTP